MDDDDYGPYGTKLGKLSTGFMSHEEFMALAQSIVSPVVFLDVVEDFLKRVHTVFEQKQINEEGEFTFFKRPNKGNLAVLWLSSELDSLIVAWHLASEHNQEVAAFKIDTLQNLQSVISRENEDILEAFCGADNELSKHRAKHELAARIRETHGKTELLWTPEAETEAQRLIDDKTVKTAEALQAMLSIKRQSAQELFRHITGKTKKKHRVD